METNKKTTRKKPSNGVKEGRPTLEEPTQTKGAFKVNLKVPEVTKNK